MDKKAVLLERNKLSRLLGTQTEDDSLERNIFLLQSLDRQKDIVDIIAKVYVLIKDGQDAKTFEDIRNEVRELILALDKYQEALSKEFKVFVSNFPETVREVRISNAQDLRSELPKEIRVSNLREIKPKEFPEEISIKKPSWFKEFDFDKLFKFFKDSTAGLFNEVKTSIFNSFIKNTKPKEAIPVRLVTEDGERFYRAGNVFVGNAGASGDPMGLKDIAGAKINPAKEDGNLAGIKTNTDKIPSDPVRESGILQIISSDIRTAQPRDVAKKILKKTIIISSSGVVHTPAANKKIALFSVKFSLSADMSAVSFRWTQGGADFEKYLSPKAGGLYGANNHPDYIEGGVDEPLYCSITGSGNVQINMDYLEI